MVSRQVQLGPDAMQFTVERTRRQKTIALSYGLNGLRVLAPGSTLDIEIDDLVKSKATWILSKKAHYDEIDAKPAKHEFINGETFHYLGRQYRLRLTPDNQTVVSKVKLKGRFFEVLVPDNIKDEILRASIRAGMRTWFTEKAHLRLPKSVECYAGILGHKSPPTLIRSQDKRWGSCNHDGKLRLNWQLVCAPSRLIDYVVAHEICHLEEFNHSERFWRVMERVMPDYRERKRQLRLNGHRYLF